mgnify:CR=1 FL=1
MKHHSLKEYIEFYNPTTIQLICGNHIINIHLECSGSAFIVRAFEKDYFYLERFTESCKHLILNTVK